MEKEGGAERGSLVHRVMLVQLELRESKVSRDIVVGWGRMDRMGYLAMTVGWVGRGPRVSKEVLVPRVARVPRVKQDPGEGLVKVEMRVL